MIRVTRSPQDSVRILTLGIQGFKTYVMSIYGVQDNQLLPFISFDIIVGTRCWVIVMGFLVVIRCMWRPLELCLKSLLSRRYQRKQPPRHNNQEPNPPKMIEGPRVYVSIFD